MLTDARTDQESGESGLSDSQVRNCHSLCYRALEKAVSEKLIARNPAVGCKLPPIKRNEMKILSRESMQKLLIQAKEENYYELFLLELATGLRLGELAALQWDDLNLTTGELRISKQATIAGAELVISEPKTKAAVRTLILPPSVRKVLAEYKTRVNSKWLFPSSKKEGLPMLPASVRHRLDRILDHAGCERVRFHDLRHTFATNALANGMDVKTLSTILGHVSAATTLNTYSHVTDEMRQKAAMKIDKGIAKAEVQEIKSPAKKERTMTDFQARKRWSKVS
jgi:integrase